MASIITFKDTIKKININKNVNFSRIFIPIRLGQLSYRGRCVNKDYKSYVTHKFLLQKLIF